MVAFVTLIFVIITVIYFIAMLGVRTGEIYYFPPSTIGFFKTLPIFAANFECHTNSVSFYKEYKALTTSFAHSQHIFIFIIHLYKTTDKSFKKYVFVVFTAFGLVFVLSSVFATLCYLTIGRFVSDDALKNLPKHNLILAASISVVFSLIVCYALFLNSIRISLHFVTFNSSFFDN